MVSLASVTSRFEIPFTVIEGGRGVVRGVLTETDQNSQPSYIFVQPRHVLRTRYPTALRPGMVLQTKAGSIFIVGANGPSENTRGTLWQSFRLFEPTAQVEWRRRQKVMDPIAKVLREGGEPELLGRIWVAIEPMDREAYDVTLRTSFEQTRFITGAAVQSDDLVDNRTVTKVDKQLGLSIGVLT